jgi:beta-galactosidase
MKSKRGKLWFIGMGLKLKKKMNASKKGKDKGEKKSGGFDVDLKDGSGLMEMMGGFTVLRLTSMLGMMNVSFTKEELLKLNRKLNRIKKPKDVK